MAKKPANFPIVKLRAGLITGRPKPCPRIAVVNRKAGIKSSAANGQRQLFGLTKPLRSERTPESRESAPEIIQAGMREGSRSIGVNCNDASGRELMAALVTQISQQTGTSAANVSNLAALLDCRSCAAATHMAAKAGPPLRLRKTGFVLSSMTGTQNAHESGNTTARNFHTGAREWDSRIAGIEFTLAGTANRR